MEVFPFLHEIVQFPLYFHILISQFLNFCRVGWRVLQLTAQRSQLAFQGGDGILHIFEARLAPALLG